MHLTHPEQSAADLARLRRLGAMLAFLADLPVCGATVLVGDRGAMHELRDLLVQYRGVRVNDETRVLVCLTEAEEKAAVAGRDMLKVYAAPGFNPKWAIPMGGQIRRSDASRQTAEMMNDLCGPRAYHRANGDPGPNAFFPQVVERSPVPGALKHAWPTTPAAATPAVNFPLPNVRPPQATDAPSPVASGPWHKPAFVPRRSVEVVVRSRFLPGDLDKPYRLFADTPFGSGYVSVHDTQEEADAALPAFVQHVRELWLDHAARNDTVVTRLAA